MSRIIVTGSAGFLGSHIVDSLIERGHNVLSIDDMSGGFWRNINPKCEFCELDLRDKIETEIAVKIFEPEILVHCAANAREGASFFDPINICERNLLAYINILEPCIKYGIKRCIVFSSMAVYGNQIPPFSELMACKPVDVYGSNKVAMEEITKQLSELYKFKYVIIRPHNCWGIRQSLRDKMRNVVAIFMNRIMRDEPLYIYGNGLQKRAFSYIKDSLPCYIKCIEDESIENQTYNIGGINPVTINYLAELVIKAFNKSEHPVIHLPDRYGEVKNAWSTYEQSVQELGYKENYTMNEAILEMKNWALDLGPQDWTNEILPLEHEKLPETWRKKEEFTGRRCPR